MESSTRTLEKVTGDEAGYGDKSDMEHRAAKGISESEDQTTASDNNNH